MTAIVAVVSEEGFAVHSDSLAMNIEECENEVIRANFIDRIDKHRQKVYKISSHVVVGFTGKNFPLDLMRPISNTLKDTVKNCGIKTVLEIAKVAKGVLKRELKKGQEVEMLFVGYDINDSGLAGSCSMVYVDSKYTVRKIEENYYALGAGQLISYTLKMKGHQVPLFSIIDLADKQADKLMGYLSNQEKLSIESGDNDWHIGGLVKRLHITPNGVIKLPSIRSLPIRVNVGDIFDMDVKI